MTHFRDVQGVGGSSWKIEHGSQESSDEAVRDRGVRGVALALTVTLAPASSADLGGGDALADEVAGVIGEVAPDASLVPFDAASVDGASGDSVAGRSAVADVGGAEVSADAGGVVVLEAPPVEALSDAVVDEAVGELAPEQPGPEAVEVSVAIGLPEVSGLDLEGVAEDGTLVYGSDEDVSLAVQALDDGARLLVVIEEAGALLSYDFAFDIPEDVDLVLREDGGVDLLASDGWFAGSGDVPWAFDADGRAVPTSYLIEGDVVTQVVEHADGDYAYPVVADPSISLGWYIYVRYSKSEIQRYWSGTDVANKVAFALACQAIPFPYNAACTVASVTYMNSIGQTFKDAKRYNQCVELRLTYYYFVPVGWSRYSC